MSHWPLISWPSVCLLPASRSGLRMNDIIHWDGTRANNQWEVLPTCYRKSRFSFVWLVWQEAIPRYKCWQFLLQNDRDVFWPQKCQNVQNAQNEKNPIEAANCLSAWVDILASECHVLLLDIHQRVKLQKIWKKTISFFFLLSSVDWKRNVSVCQCQQEEDEHWAAIKGRERWQRWPLAATSVRVSSPHHPPLFRLATVTVKAGPMSASYSVMWMFQYIEIFIIH